jgi:hypothetical protein
MARCVSNGIQVTSVVKLRLLRYSTTLFFFGSWDTIREWYFSMSSCIKGNPVQLPPELAAGGNYRFRAEILGQGDFAAETQTFSIDDGIFLLDVQPLSASFSSSIDPYFKVISRPGLFGEVRSRTLSEARTVSSFPADLIRPIIIPRQSQHAITLELWDDILFLPDKKVFWHTITVSPTNETLRNPNPPFILVNTSTLRFRYRVRARNISEINMTSWTPRLSNESGLQVSILRSGVPVPASSVELFSLPECNGGWRYDTYYSLTLSLGVGDIKEPIFGITVVDEFLFASLDVIEQKRLKDRFPNCTICSMCLTNGTVEQPRPAANTTNSTGGGNSPRPPATATNATNSSTGSPSTPRPGEPSNGRNPSPTTAQSSESSSNEVAGIVGGVVAGAVVVLVAATLLVVLHRRRKAQAGQAARMEGERESPSNAAAASASTIPDVTPTAGQSETPPGEALASSSEAPSHPEPPAAPEAPVVQVQVG